jgi:hypothetical protein
VSLFTWPRVVAGLLGVAAVVAVFVIVSGWKSKADDWPALNAELNQAHADLVQARQDFVDVQEVSNGYQQELEDLRVAAARERIPVVRVCRVPADPESRRLSPAERGPDETGAGAGQLPQAAEGDPRAGRDIGAELFAEADRADELAAQARWLQEYVRGCSGELDAPDPVVEPDVHDRDAEALERGRRLNRTEGIRTVGSP